MKNKDIAQWITALRSGDYLQGLGLLCYENSEGCKYCCLSVMVDELYEGSGIIDGSWWIDSSCTMPSRKILQDVGLDRLTALRMASFNDEKLWSFDKIADWLEENRETLRAIP